MVNPVDGSAEQLAVAPAALGSIAGLQVEEVESWHLRLRVGVAPSNASHPPLYSDLLHRDNQTVRLEAALRSLTYNNTLDEPALAQRVVEVVVSDGTGTSVPVYSHVTISPINDHRPVVSGTGARRATYVEHAGAVALLDA